MQIVCSNLILDFPEELFLCANETSGIIGASIPNANYTYLWDTGETTSSLVVTENGFYTVTATKISSGTTCTSTKSVKVVISELPVITDVEITDLQSSNTVRVFINLEGDYQYQLDDEESQLSAIFNGVLPGMHTLKVMKQLRKQN